MATLARNITVIGTLLVGFASPVWGKLDLGVIAYLQGDYAAALRECRPAAEQGNAVAQTILGVLFHRGLGVQQDVEEARRWYHLAAEQGLASAQYYLGRLYVESAGTERDPVQAFMWMDLAASQGSRDFVRARDALMEVMTPAQIAEGRKLTKEWKSRERTSRSQVLPVRRALSSS
jgi:hypothetical protein